MIQLLLFQEIGNTQYIRYGIANFNTVNDNRNCAQWEQDI